ncbi:hypothetical protein [Sphingobacterium sp.]|uniref:hypothetical protein n=1 Tax=Sphingobacterium sp. TaxID=341027 RepID=UPI0031D133AA
MLSEKIKEYLKEESLYDETEDENYQRVITKLNIDQNSAFADFNTHTNAVTFSGKGNDLYNVCWFAINSSYYDQVKNMSIALKLPEEYIPLDSFEVEGGYFYNRNTGQVLELELGNNYVAFQNGTLQPQWEDFNSFLEWYFEIT